MSVKVGVRVRPFNQRETDLGCKLCVDMIGNMTKLFDADDPESSKHRDFTFVRNDLEKSALVASEAVDAASVGSERD